MKRTSINKAKLIVAFTLFTSVVFAQWGTNGNALSSGDFLGSTNSFPLIFKTNNGTRLYITEGGFVGIGTTSPAQALDVNGNLNVSGTSAFGGNMSVTGNITANCFTAACLNIAGNLSIDNITTNDLIATRILSPTGVIHLGDSSLLFDDNRNIISWTNSSATPYAKGLKIARLPIPPNPSTAYDNILALGNGSIAIGAYSGTGSSATGSVVIGTGTLSNPLINDIPFSFMLGFNSNIPTLFVGPANGAGSVGKVGIGTSAPQRALHVMGTGRFENTNGYVDVEFNTVHGILNSSEDLLINYYSQKQTFIGPGMLTASGDFTAQNNAYLATATGSVGIGTSNATAKLTVKGDFSVVDNNGLTQFKIDNSGKMTIGTDNPGTFKLAVEGKIGAREIQVTNVYPFPDFVFKPEHKLMPLNELENYVNTNQHLPQIPSAGEVEKNNGVNIGEMQVLQLEKIEEIYLHLISLNRKIEQLQKETADLKTKLQQAK